jgi:hypothetical protein
MRWMVADQGQWEMDSLGMVSVLIPDYCSSARQCYLKPCRLTYPAFTAEMLELQQGQDASLEQSRHHRREIAHWRYKWRRGDVRQYE